MAGIRQIDIRRYQRIRKIKNIIETVRPRLPISAKSREESLKRFERTDQSNRAIELMKLIIEKEEWEGYWIEMLFSEIENQRIMKGKYVAQQTYEPIEFVKPFMYVSDEPRR